MRYSLDRLTNREFDVLVRIAEGASNQEIAEELFLSLNTVKWHSRNIFAKLDVNSRTQALLKAAELGLLEERSGVDIGREHISRHNLPGQLSSFIGRVEEITQIKELLENQRLVTITGTGGVGKPRLALKVAEELLKSKSYPDGIFLVELAALTRPERIPEAIRDDLGLSSQSGVEVDDLKNYLSDQKSLLILDNFENLLEAAPLVSDLLSAAQDLKILATSREALHLSGEQIYPLKPLSIGEVDSSIKNNDAVQLFMQRAREANPHFSPTDKDFVTINEICARLDGLPLAIELAVARLNLFSLSALLDQLEDRFAILSVAPRDSPKRHQTLQKSIQWSYDLLKEEEQSLFRRLAVFQGSRTIDAVEMICCFDLEIDVLEGLASLLSKNLICQEEGIDDQPRFYLLETLHEYARFLMEESGESDDIQRRHADFFVSLVLKDKDLTLTGSEQIKWLNSLKADHENLRKVYSWSMGAGEVKLALRLVSCLGIFWIVMGSFDEGVQWVKECLDFIDSVPADIQADLYRVAGSLFLVCCGEHDLSKEMYNKALSLYTLLEDVREMGWSHVGLIGTSEMFPEEREFALENLAKSIEYLSEVNDRAGLYQAWCNMGCHYSLSGDCDQAREAWQKSLAIARELEDPMRIKGMLGNLGALDHRDGDVCSACELYKESITIGIEAGMDVIYSADILIDIAYTELDLDRPRRAVVLLGAADNFYRLGDYRPQIQQYKYMKKIRDAIQSAVDENVFEQAWQEGQALSPEEAIAFALKESLTN